MLIENRCIKFHHSLILSNFPIHKPDFPDFFAPIISIQRKTLPPDKLIKNTGRWFTKAVELVKMENSSKNSEAPEGVREVTIFNLRGRARSRSPKIQCARSEKLSFKMCEVRVKMCEVRKISISKNARSGGRRKIVELSHYGAFEKGNFQNFLPPSWK